MVTDLHLTQNQYGLCLTVFFIFFSLAEVPSNILLKRLKPHIWLPAIMVAWGVTTISIGFVTNFAGLATARAFLGLTEAGL
jgi:MFS family permease